MSSRSNSTDKAGKQPTRLVNPIVCSKCFLDQGLRLEAENIGSSSRQKCPNCGSNDGFKLSYRNAEDLFHSFFYDGTFFRADFGGASRLAANPHRYGERDVEFPTWLEADVRLLEDKLKIGLFHYGPPLWRIGEIEPLSNLRDSDTRLRYSHEFIKKFPAKQLTKGDLFYRIRKNLPPEIEIDSTQYDSPPKGRTSFGRLDSSELPVLYGSKDLEICIHECRVLIPDECFVATLETTRNFRMLDLTSPPQEATETPFESLDIAMRFLFSATDHAYEITRSLSHAAHEQGFDGIYYPSYFSLVKENTIENIVLFGRPISSGDLKIKCINRAMLRKATYEITMGPLFK